MRVIALAIVATTSWLVSTTTPLLAEDALDLKEMRKYFDRLSGGPYTFLQAPRTGLGVGTIYSIVDGQTVFYSRPEACFAPQFLAKAANLADAVAVSNFDKSGKYTWQLGLRVANAGPITEEVKAEFQKKRVSSLVMRTPQLKRQLIPIKDLQDAVKNQMDLDCRATLTAKKPERWIIIETLYADDYSVEFQDSNGTQLSVAGGIIKVLFPSLKYDGSGEVKGALKFSGQPHIVAMKAVRVKDITRFAAGEISLEPVPPSLMYDVFDRR